MNGQYRRAQSAMEYLMTYGWAILIIAVVLGALYSLGVFNGISFAPKASAGSCQVFRPSGPGTTTNINLEGECQGLMPQYVAQFNGQNSIINIPSNLPAFSQWTISGWVYVKPITTTEWGSTARGISTGYGVLWGGVSGSTFRPFFDAGGAGYAALNNVPTGQWVMLVFSYNGVAVSGYGYTSSHVYTATQSASLSTIPTQTWQLGAWGTTDGSLNGSLANVQVYNTSFDANQVAALYQEGIGGAPITIQNLIGWWPLNGNANDYSGNNNNGQSTNVIYTGSWTNGYTAP